MDERFERVRNWTAERLPGRRLRLSPASADASFRRYFRAEWDTGSAIVMDAPPELLDCRPFVEVAGLLRAAGVHVPEIYAADFEQGLLLLGDLGRTTYLEALSAPGADADGLLDAAIAALIRWQCATRPGVLPVFDRAFLRREMELFPEWYLGRHLGLAPDAAERAMLDAMFRLLEDSALAQPQVYMHRDYMPRNLMVCERDNPGVLDFQDAVLGPIAYDAIALLRDAFLSWPEARVEGWLRRYHARAAAAGLPVGGWAKFRRAADWIGLQRHLKILGLFARLHYRDGKPRYLADTPRFIGYARTVTARYRELAALAALFDALAARAGAAA